MLPRPRPALLTAAFVILFAAMANLAWATAITTTGPWYDAGVSADVYALSAAIAALMAILVVRDGSRSAAALDGSVRRVDRRIGLLRAKMKARPPDGVSPSPASLDEFDLDSAIDGLEDPGPTSLVRIERTGHDTLVPLAIAPQAVPSTATTEVLRQLVSERVALREARARVWATVAGPVVLCLAFLAIAGPMLPGSGPFATAHYQMNTALVLFLAYGLAPLVAWCALGLVMLGAPGRRSPE